MKCKYFGRGYVFIQAGVAFLCYTVVQFFWQHLTFQLLGNFVVSKDIQPKELVRNALKPLLGLLRLEETSLDLTENIGLDGVMGYTAGMLKW